MVKSVERFGFPQQRNHQRQSRFSSEMLNDPFEFKKNLNYSDFGNFSIIYWNSTNSVVVKFVIGFV